MRARRRLQHTVASGLLVASGMLGAAWAAETALPPAAVPAAGTQAVQPARPSVSTQATVRPGQVRAATPAPRAEAQPMWAELTAPQQQSLAPLAGTWKTLSEAHKRKWIALSANFASMPQPEQARLHSRMTEWAALSPQQRNVARLNFAEAQKVAPTDKRAKWEAYQALPAEEKSKLAARAAAAKPAPPPTAVAVKPVPQQKLAKIPKNKKSERVAGVPGPVQGNALLPQPAPSVQP
jgi:hypothetical protein